MYRQDLLDSLFITKVRTKRENPSEVLPATAPTWVTQWAALTSQQKNKKMDAPSPDSQRSSLSDKDASPDSKKATRGLSRKRPGTGRRLPSLPPDKSPSGSQCSSRLSQSTDSQSPRCPSTPRYGENNNLDSAKSKVVTIANKVVNRFEDTDTETVSRTKFESDTDSVATESIGKSLTSGEQTPKSSVSTRSVASVDTEILLKDTETVMAAMEARMESKHDGYNGIVENGDALITDRRFSDSESMVALVNGDDDFEKPTQYESPRQNLARNKGLKQHKPLTRVSSATARLQAFREKNYKRNSWTEASVVPDVLSDTTSKVDLETTTERSDISVEDQESGASFNRSGSKGKGQISMTRPNRAFQLRRLKADGGEPPESPNTGISTALSLTNVSDTSKSNTSAGSATPTRLNKSMNRLSYPASKQDSARSGNSLGGQIVARSRQGLSSERSEASLGDQIASKAKRNSANFVRSDGGRYSLKLSRSLSTQDSINSTGDTSSYTSSPTRKPDFKAIKSRLKTTPSYGLSVQGMSSRSSNSSQPTSRSNSPRSAEKAAWKRRKEYDPRKAVAEAKAKAKECKVKTDSTGRIYGRMTRSASFTNTKELQRYKRDASAKSDSVSSADDTSFASEVNDVYDDSRVQRGFVPYTGRSQSSRLFSASEDEEVGLMVKSAHDLSQCVVGNLRYKSAFTPPPPKSNPSPRSSPSSLPLSVFKKRYSYDSNKSPASSSKTKASHQSQSSTQNSQVQSYDGILVSSIYQLALKMKTNTDRTMQKLRDGQLVENGLSSPSPIEDILNHSSNSDMPGWKQANQELAGILKNLRKLDHHIQVMHRALFPDDDSCSDSPGLSGREKQEYLQEIERIRGELAGFQPISTPDDPWKRAQDEESIESDCEELGAGEEFF